MANRLEGKVALITGGASGFGKKTAEMFKAEGAVVYISDINQQGGESVAEEFGLNFLHHDVTITEDWEKVIDHIKGTEGKLNILVNNAGYQVRAPLEEITVEQWDKVHDVNIKGTFLGTRAVIPVMRKMGHGSIVNVSSNAGNLGISGASPPYVASKGGIRAFSRYSAVEYGRDGIRVNCVIPGFIQNGHLSTIVSPPAG